MVILKFEGFPLNKIVASFQNIMTFGNNYIFVEIIVPNIISLQFGLVKPKYHDPTVSSGREFCCGKSAFRFLRMDGWMDGI